MTNGETQGMFRALVNALPIVMIMTVPAFAQSPADRPLPAQTKPAKKPLTAASPAPTSAADRQLQPIPEPPPAPPELAADPSLEPQITIQRRGNQTVEEYRIRGRLYMVKVTPAHGVPYYLVDEGGRGDFTRQDSYDTGSRPPMWVIHSF